MTDRGPVFESIWEHHPLTLGIEVAEILLTLENLLDLVPGSIIEIPLQREETVVMKLGDTPVAEARVLSEDGRCFLEIVRIFDEGETLGGPCR